MGISAKELFGIISLRSNGFSIAGLPQQSALKATHVQGTVARSPKADAARGGCTPTLIILRSAHRGQEKFERCEGVVWLRGDSRAGSTVFYKRGLARSLPHRLRVIPYTAHRCEYRCG